MEIEFIHRVIKTSLMASLLAFVFLSAFSHFFDGVGVLIGAIWGCVNLFLLKHVMRSWLTLGEQDYLQMYTLVGIKFPILYVLGYGILNIEALSILSLVMGFSLIFLVIFFKGLAMGFLKKSAHH